jgi:hypothetical protein
MLQSSLSEGELPSNLEGWHLPISSCARTDQSKEIALFSRKRIKDKSMTKKFILADPIHTLPGIPAPIIFGRIREVGSETDLPGSFPSKLGMKPEKLAQIAVLVVIVFPVGQEFIDKLIIYYLHQHTNKWHYAIYLISEWKLAVKTHISEPYMSGLTAPLHGRDIPIELCPRFPPSPSSDTYDQTDDFDDEMTSCDNPIPSQVETYALPSTEDKRQKVISLLTKELSEQYKEKLQKLEDSFQRDLHNVKMRCGVDEEVDTRFLNYSPMLQPITATESQSSLSMCSSANSSACTSGYVSCSSEFTSPNTSPDRPRQPSSTLHSGSIFRKARGVRRNLLDDFSGSVGSSSLPSRLIVTPPSSEYSNNCYTQPPRKQHSASMSHNFPSLPKVSWSGNI